MRKLIFVSMLLLAACFVSARLVVTEVMYHPSQEQGGNYDEWIELYNDGPALEFSGYMVNGKSISPANVSSNQVFVVAEKLYGNGSLDSYYGNNDGAWDSSDPFVAVDASSFSLDDSSGFVNISNGVEEIITSYDSSWGAGGNGKTLERSSLTSEGFVESPVLGGSPGSFSSNVSSSDGSLGVDASINNIAPFIASIAIGPDDSPEPGIQVYPDYNNDKLVSVSAEVIDDNGFDDVSKVVLEVSGKTPELVSIEDLNETLVRYSWSVVMKPEDKQGIYQINVTSADSQGISSFNSSSFEFAGLLSMVINSDSINFGSLDPGSFSMKNITLRNNGNSVIDVEVSGSNLTNGDKSIPSSRIECFSDDWFALGQEPQLVDLNLDGSASRDLSFRFNAPFAFKADKYSGTVLVAAIRG